VLFVNHVSDMSGAELSLLELVEKLDRGRFLPIVACPEGVLAERLRELHVPHVSLRLRRITRSRALNTLLRDLLHVTMSALRLAGIIKRLRIDLVHANSTTACMSAGPAAKLTGVALVWHVRDLVELGRTGRLLYRLADAVACISEAVERRVARVADDLDKLWTVTNGIDVARLRSRARPETRSPMPQAPQSGASLPAREAVRREFNIAEDAPVMSQVSQFTPWKGHSLLLEALVRVKAEFPAVRLLLVGRAMTGKDASYLDRLRLMVGRLGLSEVVSFTGWREDVASIIDASDLVVVPSREEPFGRAALEAMALGKPVIGLSAGALPEIVSHRQTGILIDRSDPGLMADAILKLLRSPDMRRHMGQNAADEAERFDITRTVNQVQNLYADLLEDR
jgi:glycosyltransferase involved in cell wall biosynthesis